MPRTDIFTFRSQTPMTISHVSRSLAAKLHKAQAVHYPRDRHERWCPIEDTEKLSKTRDKTTRRASNRASKARRDDSSTTVPKRKPTTFPSSYFLNLPHRKPHHIFPISFQSWEGRCPGLSHLFSFSQNSSLHLFLFPFPCLFSFLQIPSACGGRQSPPRGRVEQHGADPCAKASARGIGVILLGFSCIIHGYHYYLSIFRRLVSFSLLSLGLYP